MPLITSVKWTPHCSSSPIASAGMLALAFSACVLPTDRSEQLRVVITNDENERQLLVGDTLHLRAELRRRNGVVVPSATFGFRSGNETVGRVDETGTFFALVRGTTVIIAEAIEFQNAAPGSTTLSVVPRLDVRDVRPQETQFGAVISILGSGLRETSSVEIDRVIARVEGYVPADPNDASSLDRLRVWVPPPAAPSSRVIIREGAATSKPLTITVAQEDVFEPNLDTPAVLEIPFQNPALALEAGTGVVDWYRLQLGTPRAITIRFLLSGESVPVPVLFVAAEPSASLEAAPTWGIGWASSVDDNVPARGIQFCNGLGTFQPSNLSSDTAVIALRNIADIDLIATILDASLAVPAAYGISIVEGYQFVLPPDDAEEDDYCDAASELSIPSVDTLTLDNPGDVDWFRLTVAPELQRVTFAVSTSDSANSDMALYDSAPVPDPADSEAALVIARAERSGPLDSLSASLNQGTYLLQIWDAAGQPTRYVLHSFDADAADPTRSEITADPARIILGDQSTITVHLKNAGGANLISGGDEVTLSTDPPALASVSAPSDNGDGTYTALLSANTLGTVTVTGTVNGVAIGDAAMVSIVPTPADSAKSEITADTTNITADGTSTATITVQLRDTLGNKLERGRSNVTVDANTGSLGSVIDNGDGTYTATLTSERTGDKTAIITGKVNGADILDTALVDFTRPGDVIVDGSFSHGRSEWTSSATAFPTTRLSKLAPLTPPGLAVLGADTTGTGVNSDTGSIVQEFMIPPAAQLQLTVWWRVMTEETTSESLDRLFVTLESSTRTDTLFVPGADTTCRCTLSNNDADTVYTSTSWDLTPLAGETLTLRVAYASNATNPTVFRLDNVSVAAPEASAPASPAGGNANIRSHVGSLVRIRSGPALAGWSDPSQSNQTENDR